MKLIGSILTLTLMGCYSVVTVNLGSVNRQAGSVGKPLTPEVNCEALAQPGEKLDKIQIEALQTCIQAVTQARKK